MGGSESIVTCADRNNPNFQVWGAMSDLKCNKKKKHKKHKFKSFKEWLSTNKIHLEAITLGTEEVDESQIDSAYQNAKYAVQLVKLYDLTIPKGKKLLSNISTIATLNQGVYGLYNSKENKEVILNQLAIKPEQLNKIKMTFGQDAIGKENIDGLPRDVVKGVSLNVIKKYIPEINVSAFSPSSVIHVNVQKHLQTHKDPISAVIELASTIVHEATHELDFTNTNATSESSAVAAEGKFKNWVKNNWNMITQKIKIFQSNSPNFL